MIDKVTIPGPISLDRLAGDSAPAQVLVFDGAAPGEVDPREPHRHDYHELFVVRAGSSRHLVDDQQVSVGAGQALMIGRGQVHTLVAATDLHGVVIRFADSLLTGAAQELTPGWLLAGCIGQVLQPPARELEHAIAIADLLGDELQRPPDLVTDQLIGTSLSGLLLLVHRWQSDSAGGAPAAPTEPDAALHTRFVRLLEAEHPRHHDASWYARELAISPNHLATVLTQRTGRPTKRLITDRLMTEAQRLLRFTDLTVQQVALRLGYDDPLYLSRAFKAQVGLSPSAWRERQRH